MLKSPTPIRRLTRNSSSAQKTTHDSVEGPPVSKSPEADKRTRNADSNVLPSVFKKAKIGDKSATPSSSKFVVEIQDTPEIVKKTLTSGQQEALTDATSLLRKVFPGFINESFVFRRLSTQPPQENPLVSTSSLTVSSTSQRKINPRDAFRVTTYFWNRIADDCLGKVSRWDVEGISNVSLSCSMGSVFHAFQALYLILLDMQNKIFFVKASAALPDLFSLIHDAVTLPNLMWMDEYNTKKMYKLALQIFVNQPSDGRSVYAASEHMFFLTTTGGQPAEDLFCIKSTLFCDNADCFATRTSVVYELAFKLPPSNVFTEADAGQCITELLLNYSVTCTIEATKERFKKASNPKCQCQSRYPVQGPVNMPIVLHFRIDPNVTGSNTFRTTLKNEIVPRKVVICGVGYRVVAGIYCDGDGKQSDDMKHFITRYYGEKDESFLFDDTKRRMGRAFPTIENKGIPYLYGNFKLNVLVSFFLDFLLVITVLTLSLFNVDTDTCSHR